MSTKQLRTTLTAAQLAASGQFLTATSTDAEATLGHTTRAEAKSALGLGTSLNVTANNGGGTEPLPAYTFVGDLDTGMYRPEANTLAFSTNGTKKMTVLANGRVGIGTSDPSDLLHVDGSVRFTGRRRGFIVAAGVSAGTSETYNIDATGFDGFGSSSSVNRSRAYLYIIHSRTGSHFATGVALYSNYLNGDALLLETLGTYSFGGTITFDVSGPSPRATITNWYSNTPNYWAEIVFVN